VPFGLTKWTVGAFRLDEREIHVATYCFTACIASVQSRKCGK